MAVITTLGDLTPVPINPVLSVHPTTKVPTYDLTTELQVTNTGANKAVRIMPRNVILQPGQSAELKPTGALLYVEQVGQGSRGQITVLPVVPPVVDDSPQGSGSGTSYPVGPAGDVLVSDGTTYVPVTPVAATAADVPFTPTGAISATTVQAAIAEVAAEAGSGTGGGSVTDNGDGTFTTTGSSVTDNGDGTFTTAA